MRARAATSLLVLLALTTAPRALAASAPPTPPQAPSRPKARPPQVPPLPASIRRLVERGEHKALLQALEAHPTDLAGRRPFLLGYALLKLGRHREAAAHLEEALRRTPDLRSHALYFLAKAAEGAEDDATARRALDELLRREPGTPHAPYAYETLARIALRQGRPLRAAERLAQLLRRFPDHDRAASFLALRARALAEGGRPREAALAWRRIWLRHPESPEAARALERAQALAPLSRPPLPPLGAGDYFLRARRLQRGYFYRKALAGHRELNRLFPDSPYRRRATLHEALALFSLRRTRKARSALEEAAHLFPPGSPERAEARYHLARNHLRAGDRAAFEGEAQRLLKEAPRGKWAARTRYLLARVHEDALEYEGAMRRYNEVVRKHLLSPLLPKALWQLSWIRLRAKAHGRAFEGFQKMVRRFPNHPLAPSALYWSGVAAERAGKPGKAVAQYRKCAQTSRHQYYGHLAMEALDRLARAGNLDAARPLARRAAGFREWTRPPGGAPGRAALARWRVAETLASMGLHDLAGEEFDRLGPAPFFRYRAARSFTRGGLPERAIAILRASFGDALRSGGGDLPREFWRIAFPMRVSRREPGGADPLLVNAVIMAESAFDPKAFSPAGAMGLMQLMPATGRHLAKIHKVRLSSEEALFDPAINLRLGARHLGDLLGEFGGALVPAIASYNAGRRAVKRWWRARGGEPIASFIERIPYEETRNYVRKVLGYYREYRRIYAGNEAPPDRTKPPS